MQRAQTICPHTNDGDFCFFSLSHFILYIFFLICRNEYKSKMLRLILVRYHFGIGIGMQCYCMLINLVENVIALNVECVCVFSPRAPRPLHSIRSFSPSSSFSLLFSSCILALVSGRRFRTRNKEQIDNIYIYEKCNNQMQSEANIWLKKCIMPP